MPCQLQIHMDISPRTSHPVSTRRARSGTCTQCPKIKPLHISENCVFMLLDRIDVSKSSGPDKLPGGLLQCLTKEITPVVHYIFTQSLCTGELPTEWTQANVAHILKKGSKLQAVNYRPVSLTCITCKLFEHIICNTLYSECIFPYWGKAKTHTNIIHILPKSKHFI